MTFEHLPSRPNKLEFSLVNQIKNSEITDYALVAGDSAKQMTIRYLHWTLPTKADI